MNTDPISLAEPAPAPSTTSCIPPSSRVTSTGPAAQHRGRYQHIRFTQASHPDLAAESWRIQAEGYCEMAFVHSEAVTDQGCLPEDIDRSRGAYIRYYIAENVSNPDDRATIRLNRPPPGGDFRDLPAYTHCGHAFTPSGAALLEVMDEHGVMIKEVAGMARTRKASPLSVHELVRVIVQEAMHRDEAWLVTTVQSTHHSLVQTYAQANFIELGDPQPIGDTRVNTGVRLQPSLVIPKRFIDNIAIAQATAPTAQDRIRLSRSLRFLCEGLDADMLSDRVRRALQDRSSPAAPVAADAVLAASGSTARALTQGIAA